MSRASGVIFTDLEGNELQTWQVPLDEYVEAHEAKNLTNDWAGAHRLIVARALNHSLPVPPEIVAQHDVTLLAAEREREGRFHQHPSKACRMCPQRKGDEDDELLS